MNAWATAAKLALVALAALVAGQRSARAEASSSPVVIELVGCDPILQAEVRRIAAVELRATVEGAVAAGVGATRVVATCHGSQVDLLLAGAGTEQRLARTVALSEAAPTGRARLFALAVAELVVASRQEIRNGPESAGQAHSPGRSPPAATRAMAEASRQPASAMVEAIGVVRTFPGSGLWLWGAGGRGLVTLSRPLTLAIEATAEWGTASRATGQVAARAMGGALGAGWGLQRKWAFVMPWVGARAGVARLTGEPSSQARTTLGATQSGPWLGPELGALVALFPHAAVHAVVALSVGAALLGVRGDVTGERNVNLLGPWVALVAGVGL